MRRGEKAQAKEVNAPSNSKRIVLILEVFYVLVMTEIAALMAWTATSSWQTCDDGDRQLVRISEKSVQIFSLQVREPGCSLLTPS